MKSGKSLVELAKEIERQSMNKQDMVADTRNLSFVVSGTDDPKVEVVKLAVRNGETHLHNVRPLAHAQIAERVGIPQRYYDRMLTEQPELLAHNVNTWFSANPHRRMVRLLDGNVRAFLSDRYQRIENDDIAKVVLPILVSTPGIEVMSTEITESRLYIKAVTHKVTGEIKSKRVGDIVEAGVLISNSEIGMGAVNVKPFFNFLVCTNGMVRDRDSMKRAHLGGRQGDENIVQFLTDETKIADDHAVLLKVRDVVRAAMDAEQFSKAIAAMQETTEQRITGNPVKAVEVLTKAFSMNQDEGASIMRHLIEGGDLSRYGLMNAVTRTAEDLQSYDRATEFETFGGHILDLPSSDWNRIAIAA